MSLADRRYREPKRSWDQLRGFICPAFGHHSEIRGTAVPQMDCWKCFEKEMIRRDLCLRHHDAALICSICATGLEPEKGPEKAIAWWHELRSGQRLWCPASNIHERIRKESGDWYGTPREE